MDVRTGSGVRPATVPAGYTFRAELPAGRLGRALLCRDDGSGREVVVRVLGAPPRDERARAVLETELAAAVAASRHPCAVPIEAAFTDERLGACVRRRYCPGGSAQSLLDAGAAWQTDDVVLLGLRAAAALAYSHRLGVLHLDVRPANLLADEGGEWSLADGGLTRAAFGAAVALDARYAARELLGWEEPGPACDVYGLGATLHVLLGGEPAAAGGEPGPPRPGLPAALAGLVARMTAADPSARPPLAEVDRVLRLHLGRAAAGRAPDPEAPAERAPVPLPVRQLSTIVPEDHRTDVADRRRRAIAVAAGIGVLFVAGAVVTVASLDGGEEDPGPVAASELGPARMDPAVALSHLPKAVTLSVSDDRYLFTWEPPSIAKNIAGYVVVLTLPPDQQVVARRYAAPTETLGVFAGPLNASACYTVGTLVDDGDAVRLAAPEPECKDLGVQVAKAEKAALIAEHRALRNAAVVGGDVMRSIRPPAPPPPKAEQKAAQVATARKKAQNQQDPRTAGAPARSRPTPAPGR